jgi:DNA-binding PadR family transcriptional regulator
MSVVFSHGRLRLYLLKLLAEGPKHGYELIRLLEKQFLGLYAPSAGTIYPRLQRMEADSLVRHTAAGGRKVYELTDAGRAELTDRASELATLETEIADLTTMANEVEPGVRGSVRDIKREMRQAAREARVGRQGPRGPWQATSFAAERAGPAATELEQHAAALLVEVRRLARTSTAGAEAVRAAAAVLDTALDQVRRLLR